MAVVGAATALGFHDRFGWLFELFGIFRLQYAGLAGVAVAAALALRSFRLAAVAVVLAAANVVPVASSWRGASNPQVDPGAPRLRLLFVNVRFDNREYDRLADVVRRERPDVVGVAELTGTWAQRLGPRLAAYRTRRLAPQEGAYGIGLYSRLPLAARVERYPADGPPTVVATVVLRGRRLTLLLVHARHLLGPGTGGLHRRQLAALAAVAPRLGRRLAICGDFNAAPWSWPVQRLVDAGRLEDSHRGRGYQGSFPVWLPPLRVPIDNCLVRGAAVLERRLGPSVGSDHFPLLVELALAP